MCSARAASWRASSCDRRPCAGEGTARERAPRRHIRGGPLVVPVCTAAALQRYELALSSRARAVPSSSILEAVASGRPSPPGSRASRSAFGRRTTSASWTRARGSRRGARRRGEGVCDERPKRQPKRRVGASPFWPIVARQQSSSPSPEIAGAAERLGASVCPRVDSSARALEPMPWSIR